MQVVDLAIVIGYNVAVLALGCGFLRGARSSERFMAAGRSMPGWALGLSVFGSYISSISFLANPGKAYVDNWNPFVFAFAMPLAAWAAARWFVPFYRRSGEVSAYQHLEHRFGPWARTYAVVCFVLIQLARLGTILYLLALALEPLVGCDVKTIIIVAGVLVTVYPLVGGTEAVIWLGVVQAVVLLAGVLACITALLIGMPDGPGEIVRIAAEHGKFSLGSFGSSVSESTFWVVLLYGLVTHLQNLGIDQSYVQRYITAKTDGAAARSVWLGMWLYIPVSAAFFFVGTALFAFYRVQPERLPTALDAAAKPDSVFPHFISAELPTGLVGLVIAAICAAAMDSNLNCCATLILCDVYRRYVRPGASERESLWVLRLATLAIGSLSTAAALAMLRVRTALDAWWQLAGIFSGGMLGLFLLGLLSRRAGGRAGLLAVACGILTILWLTFSPRWDGPLARWRSPFHNLLILVIGTAVVLSVGAAVALLGRVRESKSSLS
jgi:SSS family solute:Na+ symporter